MAIELYKHNEQAYEKVKKMFEKENRCAIIHPTGTGKSYIALKWLLDNKDKKAIYVTSHLAIKDQLERTIRENNLSIEDFTNLKIVTYSSLLHDNDMEADLIVLDEFHRAGAPKWGEAVKYLLDNNKESKVLGLTATPVRYLNRNRDMSDEIFQGNVASHITLPKAIAEGILPPPTYINAIYSFKEDIEKLEQKIAKITDEERKKELEKELKLAKRTIENAENIEEIFKNHITKENGKYLVFCRDIKHLEEMKDEANNWFQSINKNIETHYMHSLEDEEHNKYTLDRFHYVKNDNLKLLYSVGMLNEGVHVNDIDGVIMLRPTSSPILYQQQLGRALTTGKSHKPLVFDVVNNIECLKDIELLRDTVIKIMGKSNKPKKEIERMRETFKIIDDYKNISTLIKELDINATYGWEEKYKLLKEYVESHNGNFPPYKEQIIGSWLNTQKQLFKNGKLREDRQEKLDALGEWCAKNNEGHWEEKYKLLTEEDYEYVQMLNNAKELSKTEEIELLKKVKNGDAEAKEKLCEGSLPKIASIAKSFIDKNCSFTDLMSEGVLAFYETLDDYNFENKLSFSKYTYHKIYNRLNNYQKKQSYDIGMGLSQNIVNTKNQIDETAQSIEKRLYRQPTVEELAKELNVSVKKITEAIEYGQEPLSFDEKLDNAGEQYLKDILADEDTLSPEEYILKQYSEEQFKKFLETSSLNDREIQVLKLRYGFEDGQCRNLNEIKNILGIYSRERVRQIEQRAIGKLKSPRWRKAIRNELQNNSKNTR